MSKQYKKLKNGDLIEINPAGELIKFACCDCNLVHKFAFAIEKNGILYMAVERDNRATAQRRRFSKLRKE